MGHYACDMRPEWFDGYKEPKKATNTDQYFVVDHDFTVCTAAEFIERHRWVKMKWGMHDNTGAVRMQLICMAKHKKRADAETQARIDCEEAVEHVRKKLTSLKKTLKVVRPWEAK